MAELYDNNVVVEEDTQAGKFLTFSLDGETYGFEIRYVTEIISIQAITEIPEVPEYIKGIINLRGKVIPVIDVRLKFGKEEIDYNERTCIIVIDINEISVGLIVDCVDEVLTINDEDIADAPQSKTGFTNKYIRGIGKVNDNVQLLLDCNKLLKDEDVEALEAIS